LRFPETWKIRLIREGAASFRPAPEEWGLWAVTVLVVALALFPYYNPFVPR
jgi:hypothetical protein